MQPVGGYQYDFSRNNRHVFDIENRRRKAVTVARILADFAGPKLATAQVLSVGASTGVIEDFLAGQCKGVTGIDIDAAAIAFARQSFTRDNLSFQVADALETEFSDESFDIVLCNHIYEHVPDPERLMAEIRRLLRPGGFCYFTAGNRLALVEPHYNLPLLSVLPGFLADIYMRLAGRGKRYYENHRTYWGLKRLVRDFTLTDYTRRVIQSPEHFAAAYMLRPGSGKHAAAKWLCACCYWLCPTYIWVLEKKQSDPGKGQGIARQ